MNLYIIRHTIAVEAGLFEGDDSQRPLTGKGQKKMRSIAQELKELEIRLELILSRSLPAPTQTAQILAKKFDLKKEQVICTDHLAPTGHADQLVDEINEKYGNVGHIALIGHEPHLSNLASVLTTGDPNVSIVLKKGGICRLSIEKIQYGRCAMMEWLLSPALLVEIGK